MGFNDAVQSTGRTQNSPVFQQGVKVKYISGTKPINFKILPAHATGCGGQADSWTPFRDQAGKLTEWGRIVYLARFIGHGKESRRDFVSPMTFAGDSGESVFCPLSRLFQMASQYPEWSYLVNNRVNPSNPAEILDKPAINRPARHMVCNVVDADNPTTGVMLGIFTKSAIDAICGASKGVASRRTLATPEQIQQNYLAEWVVGDLTHPEYGPVLCAEKGTDKGEYSAYTVELAVDPNTRRVRFKTIGMPELTGRYNLQEPATYLINQTPEMIVQGLCEVLNMVSPAGVHEHEFLRLVFPEYESLIPTHNYTARSTPQLSVPVPPPQQMESVPPAQQTPSYPQPTLPQPSLDSGGFNAQSMPSASTLPPPAISIPASVPGNGKSQAQASSIPGITTELPSYSRDDLMNRFKKAPAA